MIGEHIYLLKRPIICPECLQALEYREDEDDGAKRPFLIHPTSACSRMGDAYYLPKVRLQKMGPEVSRNSLCNGPCC